MVFSLLQYDSCPSHFHESGFFFDFEAVRTEPRCSAQVPTHSHSKLDQLLRPREVIAALTLKFAPKLAGLRDNLGGSTNEDVRFCDDMLCKVSRSFAAVIQQLPAGCCIDICVFYLVLRALDTVEDDMTFYAGNEARSRRPVV